MSWIQTYTGKKFDLLDPTADMVCIEDIAHALSNICRFTGHTTRFYSVAEHSMVVADNVSPINKKAALLHDASEAYITDLSTPLKALLSDYRSIEKRVWAVIAEKFNLPLVLPDEVKHHDLRALVTERRDLLRNPDRLRWDERLEAVQPYEKRTRLSGSGYRQFFGNKSVENSFLCYYYDLVKIMGRNANG